MNKLIWVKDLIFCDYTARFDHGSKLSVFLIRPRPDDKFVLLWSSVSYGQAINWRGFCDSGLLCHNNNSVPRTIEECKILAESHLRSLQW